MLPVVSRLHPLRAAPARCAALLSALVGLALATPAAANLESCVASIKNQAVKAGVSRNVVDKALSGVDYDEKAVRSSRRQPEFRTPIWDYMAFLVDEERIADGREMMRRHADVLRAAEKKFGVDRHVIAAVWGVESDYGRLQGGYFIPHALANVACSGKRSKFFRKELVEALKLVSRGDLALDDLRGSWAGAFGQTQFMPSTYTRLAVDFDRDGRRDLVNSVADALGSTANYLKRGGWRTGQAWGYEVRLPDGYRGPVGRTKRASLATWAKRGLRRVDGGKLAGKRSAGLLLPAGPDGPAFLTLRNFDVIYSYNAAESYALAIAHLSDRLRGKGPFVTPWPTGDAGLSRAERVQLQILLIRAGFDVGEPDGKVGPQTRAAIEEAQKRFGMEPTGRPGRKLLEALGG